MKIRRPEDIAVAVRDARRKAGLSQVQLAERLEVNRVLVIRLEAGEPGVALGIVLRALNVLGLSLALESEDTKPATAPAKATSAKPRPRISIDEIVDD
jgi:HTH-type transcriptional regulator / antitoxin HipB